MTVSCVCGATWTGTKIEHCTARGCHQSFSGTRLGDRHRVGPHDGGRRCLTVEEMTDLGWVRRTRHEVATPVWHEAPPENLPTQIHAHGTEGLPAPDGTIHTPSIPTT